jgi:hypothetical protein
MKLLLSSDTVEETMTRTPEHSMAIMQAVFAFIFAVAGSALYLTPASAQTAGADKVTKVQGELSNKDA